MNILRKCYDAAAVFYGRGADIFWKNRFDWLRKTIRDTLDMAQVEVDAGCRVLDLGCGSGIASEEFLSRYPQTGQVIGVDLSPRMGEKAANALGEKFSFRHGDYTDASLWQAIPEKFNGILAFYTFHWIPPEKYAFVIERVNEALEDQGWILGIAMGPDELGGIFRDIIPQVLQIYLTPDETSSNLCQWNPKDVAAIERAFDANQLTSTRTVSLRYSVTYPTYMDLVSVILFQYNFWLAGIDPVLFPSIRGKLLQFIERDPRFRSRTNGIEAPHHVVIFEAHKR